MHALQINKYGGPEVMEINPQAPELAVTEGKVLVEVSAASVNPIDWKIRQGYLAQMVPLQFPVTLGGDFSGVVKAVGNGVTTLKVGDEVYGQAGALLGGSGSFAEYTVTAAKNVALKPNNLTHAEAASLPLVAVSALQALYEHLQLQADQVILIHGGAGGIGAFAIQLAKHIGAKIIATVGTDDMNYVLKLGADQTIDYKTQKFEDVIKEVDAVFDTVGGETYTRSFTVLKPGGMIVSMVEQPQTDLMEQYHVQAIAQFTQVTTERLEQLKTLVEQGVIKTHVDKTFPLMAAADALRYLETGHPRGKVVITVK